MMEIEDITLEQLNGDQHDLAELIGIDAYKKLVKYYGGGFVYVCKADTVMKINRNNEICDKFNGYNYRELANEDNRSEKAIREMSAEKIRARENTHMERQVSF